MLLCCPCLFLSRGPPPGLPSLLSTALDRWQQCWGQLVYRQKLRGRSATCKVWKKLSVLASHPPSFGKAHQMFYVKQERHFQKDMFLTTGVPELSKAGRGPTGSGIPQAEPNAHPASLTFVLCGLCCTSHGVTLSLLTPLKPECTGTSRPGGCEPVVQQPIPDLTCRECPESTWALPFA